MCQLVHEGFAREMICGCGKSAVRTLAQWIFCGLKMLVTNFGGVRRVQARAAGIEIGELPIFEVAVRIHGSANVYDAGGTEVSPSKFFFASPDDFDGFFGGAGETRGLDGGFTGVVAAVARCR